MILRKSSYSRFVSTVSKTARLLAFSALVFGGGFAGGWCLRASRPTALPVTIEIGVDAMNRPAMLKTVVTMPDGKQKAHGPQFRWKWHDPVEPKTFSEPSVDVYREDWSLGEQSGLSGWDVKLTPDKPVDALMLIRSP